MIAARFRTPSVAGAIALVLLVTACALLAMGRPPICTCGYVALWHGALDAGNSQHLLDWYSPSHLIHGLLFYALLRALLPGMPVAWRSLPATLVEAAWELVENSPAIIARYRTATIALGYTGDSVLNSLSDIGCMLAGFALAARLPVRASVALAMVLERTAALVIRDGLALNVLMLLHPVAAVRAWQAGA